MVCWQGMVTGSMRMLMQMKQETSPWSNWDASLSARQVDEAMPPIIILN